LLLAYSTPIRAPVMRKVVRLRGYGLPVLSVMVCPQFLPLLGCYVSCSFLPLLNNCFCQAMSLVLGLLLLLTSGRFRAPNLHQCFFSTRKDFFIVERFCVGFPGARGFPLLARFGRRRRAFVSHKAAFVPTFHLQKRWPARYPNPRINADAPRLLFAALGFKALLLLLAYSTLIRAPVMRKVVSKHSVRELAILKTP
jgi:hypothetical protein